MVRFLTDFLVWISMPQSTLHRLHSYRNWYFTRTLSCKLTCDTTEILCGKLQVDSHLVISFNCSPKNQNDVYRKSELISDNERRNLKISEPSVQLRTRNVKDKQMYMLSWNTVDFLANIASYTNSNSVEIIRTQHNTRRSLYNCGFSHIISVCVLYLVRGRKQEGKNLWNFIH
jgi:hypothetical protein